MKDTRSGCLDEHQMEKAVKSLPDSVEDVYAKILTERICSHENKEVKVKARLTFIWLAYSIRPLTLRELVCAASLPDPRKDLEMCTSSLVNVSREVIPRPGRPPKYKDMVKFDNFSV